MTRRRGWNSGLLALLAQPFLLALHQPARAVPEVDRFDPLFSLCLASQPAAQPQTLWHSWSLAPELLLPLLVVLVLYARGSMTSGGRAGNGAVRHWQTACFVGGWLALVVALVSPLCRMAATLASAHMVQHVILVAVATPLLVLGGPMAVIASGLPQRWRDALARWGGRRPAGLARGLRSPLAAGALYGTAIWLWHAPLLYQAALLSEALHLLMYVVLIATGLLYWHTLIATARRDPGGHMSATLVSVATVIHTGLLGALLTFAPTPWYPLLAARTTAWGLTSLEDQQLAGLIMWVPMGFIYLASGVCLLAVWLRAIERNDQRGFTI